MNLLHINGTVLLFYSEMLMRFADYADAYIMKVHCQKILLSRLPKMDMALHTVDKVKYAIIKIGKKAIDILGKE